MTIFDILVIIVTFNGNQRTIESIKSFLGNVGHIIIIDNASSIEFITKLDCFMNDPRFTLISLQENVGIGAALNIGTRFALEKKYDWILTMDQDSLIDEKMIINYCLFINMNNSIYSLAPSVYNYGIKSNNKYGYIEYAITSGNLINANIVKKLGFFNELLFIDYVDIDFSLRLRKAGFNIYLEKSAILYHELGSSHKINRYFVKFYTSHKPFRRYYMYRNLGYIVKKYFLSFPVLISKFVISNFLQIFLVIVYDKNPLESIVCIFKGIRDSIAGRYGKCDC